MNKKKPKIYIDGQVKADASGAGYIVESHDEEGKDYVVHYGKFPEHLDASNTEPGLRTLQQNRILNEPNYDEAPIFIESKSTGDLLGPEDFRLMEGINFKDIESFDPFCEGESDWFRRLKIHTVQEYCLYIEDHTDDNRRVCLNEEAVKYIEDQIKQAWSQERSSEYVFTCADIPVEEEGEDKAQEGETASSGENAESTEDKDKKKDEDTFVLEPFNFS